MKERCTMSKPRRGHYTQSLLLSVSRGHHWPSLALQHAQALSSSSHTTPHPGRTRTPRKHREDQMLILSRHGSESEAAGLSGAPTRQAPASCHRQPPTKKRDCGVISNCPTAVPRGFRASALSAQYTATSLVSYLRVVWSYRSHPLHMMWRSTRSCA